MITNKVRYELQIVLECQSDEEAGKAIEKLAEKIRLENYSSIKVLSCGISDGPWWETK